jgi:TldD protein
MQDLVERALNGLQLAGATYGDVRVVETRRESIEVKNGRPEGVVLGGNHGIGVRAVVDGAWGFAATEEVDRTVALAVQIAHASALAKHDDVRLAEVRPVTAVYATPFQTDPFAVPLETKLALLTAASTAMMGERGVVVSEAFFSGYRVHKWFGSTEGARIEQTITETGGGIAATAVKDGEIQERSYPNSFRGNFATAGWEYVTAMDLAGQAPRVASEAAALLAAERCPSKVTTLILDGGQLALQVHESIGHPIELDRVLGTEASYAGDSFLKPGDLGRLRYGSEQVNVVADATCPTGLGTFGFDDEGVPAQRTPIIERGVFTGFLTSRETAPVVGQRSNGAMRADGWSAIPLIRMTNVNLLPGAWDFNDLIADTEDGIYMATNRSWSIDNKRLNFQFGTEIAWRIEGGQLTTMYKNPTYTGMTPAFWGSCDAVCSPGHWRLWGTPNCGKGQPGQTAHVGHGVAPARFRNVRVGVLG